MIKRESYPVDKSLSVFFIVIYLLQLIAFFYPSLLVAGDCFSKLKTFWAFFRCHNSLYIFAMPRFLAIKLRNPRGFSYVKTMLKDQLFKTSRLRFDNWLRRSKRFSGLSWNRPRIFHFRSKGKWIKFRVNNVFLFSKNDLVGFRLYKLFQVSFHNLGNPMKETFTKISILWYFLASNNWRSTLTVK